jgi:hypothetical protein
MSVSLCTRAVGEASCAFRNIRQPRSALSSMTMTALLGEFGALMGDVVLRSLLILALIEVPVLAVHAVTTGVSFILATLGRQ